MVTPGFLTVRDKVDVIVFTHNHELFISEALASVINQVTDKELFIRIHDDCSQDSTVKIASEILTKWGGNFEITVQSENQYSQGSSFREKFILKSTAEYLAFLDGDDYWTDTHKIQKQVETLEKLPTAVLCHHRFSGVAADGSLTPFYPPKEFQQKLIHGTRLANHNFIGTSTVVLRRSALPERFPDGYNTVRGVDDYPIWALATDSGYIAFLKHDMTHYRLHGGQNYANQTEEKKRYQLLRALIYIANSVDYPNQRLWIDAIAGFQINSKSGGKSSLGFGIMRGGLSRLQKRKGSGF